MGSWLRRRSSGSSPPGEDPAAPVTGGASRFLLEVFEKIERRSEEGSAYRVLIVGPPSGRTIETFSRHGARVTVDGEDWPELPLSHADAAFDLVVGLDLVDLLEDETAAALGAEWARVLVPGGKVFLVSRTGAARLSSAERLEVLEDASLRALPRAGTRSRLISRGNRALERLLEPLIVDEILLRRDGLREVVYKRPT
ncbi:MAG: class I SAM-dependent methyltransferase [Acidobacteriota bacterium]|nr:class I SAM-dependent methyltransferase [Acidobacteriota bacterium]